MTESSFDQTAIFPETREGHVHSSNESARGWSSPETLCKIIRDKRAFLKPKHALHHLAFNSPEPEMNF